MGVEANLGRASVAIRATMDKLNGDLSTAHGTVDSAVGKMTRLVGKGFAAAGAAAVAGIGVATTAVAGLATTLGKLAIDAAPVEGVASAFDGLAESAGHGADEMLSALQRGSAGMVSQRDLMLSFNKAAQLVSTDFATQLPEAMGYLSKVAASTGQDMDYLMNSLVVGVGRVSPMILDNLGIQVSLAEATARAAKMYGVQESALTKAQQQAGLMAVVMERLEANTAAMPDTTETAATKLAQMRARVRDVKDEIGLAFLPTLNTLLGTVGDLADRYLPPLLSRIDELAPKVATGAEKLGEFVSALLEGESPVELFRDLLGDLFPAIADMDWRELGRDVLERIGDGLAAGGQLARKWASEHIVEPMVAYIKNVDWRGFLKQFWPALIALSPVGMVLLSDWGRKHIVDPVIAFVKGTDWGEVGRSILTKIGEGLSTGYDVVRGWVSEHIVDPVATFITETDWGAVGKSILAKLGEIWEGIKAWASEKLGGLLGGLVGGDGAPAAGEGGVLGILDQITGFVNGPGGTVLSVLGAIIGLLTGIGAPIAIIIGAVKLLSWAWEENFGGIQDIVTDVMAKLGESAGGVFGWIQGTAIPILVTLWEKFERDILPVLTTLYETVLKELWAIFQEVWAWFQSDAIPIGNDFIAQFERDILPTLRELYDEVLVKLWDTLTKVWTWISTEGAPTIERWAAVFREEILPVILDLYEKYLKNFYNTVLNVFRWIVNVAIPTLRKWGAGFRRGLQPHLERIWGRLQEFYEEIQPKLERAWFQIQRAMDRVQRIIDRHVKPALDRLFEALGLNKEGSGEMAESFGDFVGWALEVGLEAILNGLVSAIEGIANAAELAADFLEGVDNVLTFIKKSIDDLLGVWDEFTEKLESLAEIDLGDFMPGSPPPLYYALMDIAKAMDILSSKELPAFGGLETEAEGGRGSGFSWTSYAPIIVEGVQDGRGFIEELQALAV